MKKEKVIKAWLVLCGTEPQYVQMQKSTREEIETAKKFDVKIVPCRIIYTLIPPNNMKKEKVIELKIRKGQKCWLCKKEIKKNWCYNYHYFHPQCKDKDTKKRIKNYLTQ